MTRKRHKKLLMARGYSRNEAEEICRDVGARKLSHAGTYAVLVDYGPAFMEVALGKLTSSLFPLVTRFVKALTAGIEAFQQTLYSADQRCIEPASKTIEDGPCSTERPFIPGD